MSNPTPPYVNSPPPRTGPGCWAIGGVTCLVVLVLGGLALFGSVYSLMHSPTGKKFGTAMRSAMGSAQKVPECVEKMNKIREALLRYHIRNGTYPKNLAALSPDFLPDTALLHCGLDTDPDPKHTTFVYSQPKDDAPSNTSLLAFSWKLQMSLEGQTTETDTTAIMTIGGKLKQISSGPLKW